MPQIPLATGSSTSWVIGSNLWLWHWAHFNRQADERVHGVGHHVVTIEVAGDLAVDLRFRHFGVADQVPRPGGDKSHCNNAVRRIGEQHISGNLLLNETPVWLVQIEQADRQSRYGHASATSLVLVVTVRVAVMNNVEPVTCPTFAILRRRQQAVNDLFIRVRRCVLQKSIDLFGCGRKANQIEVHSAKHGGYPLWETESALFLSAWRR